MTERRPRMMPLLVVGQSHVGAIQAAAKTHRERYPDEPRTRVIHTQSELYAPEFAGEVFGTKLRAAIADQIARHTPRVASVFGGNAHNMISLMRHPRPYDFELQGEGQGPPRDGEAELVPEALVRAALEARLQTDFLRLRLFHEAAGPFIHLESPPPLLGDVFIRDRAEKHFRDTTGRAIDPASPGLRWRIWRLNSQMLRAAVEALGCRFMPVPVETQDADGFLRLEFAADPTHGNEAYGEAVIRKLERF